MMTVFYFTFGSIVLYTLFYASLGWFVIDPLQNQSSLHFWTKATQIRDHPREKITEDSSPIQGPSRNICFIRNLFSTLLCSIFFWGFMRLPISKEACTISLCAISLLTPLVVIYFTYNEFPIRYIPLLWGALIGLTAVAMFVETTAPWGISSQQLFENIFGNNAKGIIAGFFIALVSFVAYIMAATGFTKPINWYAWCIVTMTFGSGWIMIGLIWAKIF